MTYTETSSPALHQNLLSLLQGSGIIVIGMGIRIFFLFLTEITAARILLPDRYGLISWGLIFTNILCMLSGLGLNSAMRRFIPIYQCRNNLAEIRGAIIFSSVASITGGIVGSVLLFFSSSWIAVSILGDIRGSTILLILVFAIPGWNLQKTILAVFSGFKKPCLKVLVEDILVPIGFFLVVISAWLSGKGELHIASGYVFIYWLSALLTLFLVALRTPYKNSRYISPVFNAVKTLKFSLPLSISEALGKSSVGFLDILIIGILAKTYSVGLYRAASDLAVAISLVLMIFVFMYMPLATEMYANDYKYQWQDINQRIARWSMLATFPLFAVLVSFPNDVIHIVYGEEYKKAAMALRLLAIGYFGHSMVGLTAMNLVVAGFTKIQMTTHLLAFVLNISGNLLLIPILGINGAAISSVASLWAMNIFALIVMKRKLDLSPFNKIYFKNLCLLFSIVIICYLILIGSGLSSEAARLSIFLLLCTGCMGIMLRLGYLIDSTDRRLFKTLISGSIISSIKK